LGIQTTEPHDVSGDFARKLIAAPRNPNGESNASILKPYWNGDDVAERSRKNAEKELRFVAKELRTRRLCLRCVN
jgi:hypothetical protein